MQNDKISYFSLMKMMKEKRKILENWANSQSAAAMGPALFDYIRITSEGAYGSFKIVIGDRKKYFMDCMTHIHRLLQELDRRFSPSKVQESFAVLFNPEYLIMNKKSVGGLDYGRSELDFLRQKYKNFPSFDCNIVRNEWESFKQPLHDFLDNVSINQFKNRFWKDFILLKTTTNSRFLSQYKNILLLLNVYLISPTNNAECERGVCKM